MPKVLLDRSRLPHLLEAIERRGYTLIGPTLAGTAITHQPIRSADDLPRGWASAQEPGRYRLCRRDDGLAFAFGPAADSPKRYLHPPAERLWSAMRRDGTFVFESVRSDVPRLALVGIRPCDLAAIARLDAVLLHGRFVDPAYQARRRALFVVAANCTEPGGTCFCASMHTGPQAAMPFDLALTELAGSRMLIEIGSAAGGDVVSEIETSEATSEALQDEAARFAHAADRMPRRVDMGTVPAALASALDHAEWQEVGHRCLACANCTALCPTCFCHTVEDRTSLSGDRVERERRWDTCFSAGFSYIHGGSIRPDVAARYRQWATHKFSTWVQQFGTPGCVGCGRCVTWCPAGIDVLEEIRRVTT